MTRFRRPDQTSFLAPGIPQADSPQAVQHEQGQVGFRHTAARRPLQPVRRPRVAARKPASARNRVPAQAVDVGRAQVQQAQQVSGAPVPRLRRGLEPRPGSALVLAQLQASPLVCPLGRHGRARGRPSHFVPLQGQPRRLLFRRITPVGALRLPGDLAEPPQIAATRPVVVARQNGYRFLVAALGGPLQPGQVLDRRPAECRQAPQFHLCRQKPLLGRATQTPNGRSASAPVRPAADRPEGAGELPGRQHRGGSGATRLRRFLEIHPRPQWAVDRIGRHFLTDQPGRLVRTLVGRSREPAISGKQVGREPFAPFQVAVSQFELRLGIAEPRTLDRLEYLP